MKGDTRLAPCLPPPARFEGRPSLTAGGAASVTPRHPLRPRFQSAEVLYLNSNLTPGITRRPTSSAEHRSRRVGGRVHAVVRLRPLSTLRQTLLLGTPP